MAVLKYIYVFFIIDLINGEDRNDTVESENNLILKFEPSNLNDYSNCVFTYYGYSPFVPITIPTCPNDNCAVKGITPSFLDSASTCINYKYDIPLTNESKIILEYWYNTDKSPSFVRNYLSVGFMEDEQTWVSETNNLAKDSAPEWQNLTISLPFVEDPLKRGKLAIYTEIEEALLVITQITITNISGKPRQTLQEAAEIPLEEKIDAEPEEYLTFSDNTSCNYNFKNGTMKGLQSCDEWVDFGTKVIQLPSCKADENRYVLAQKYLRLPSSTQTNKALKMTPDTEILLRFWYESENTKLEYQDNYLRLALFTVSEEVSDDNRDVKAEFKIGVSNQRWQCYRVRLGDYVDTDEEMKVLLDIGLYGQRVYVAYWIITNVINPEDCYVSIPKPNHYCSEE